MCVWWVFIGSGLHNFDKEASYLCFFEGLLFSLCSFSFSLSFSYYFSPLVTSFIAFFSSSLRTIIFSFSYFTPFPHFCALPFFTIQFPSLLSYRLSRSVFFFSLLHPSFFIHLFLLTFIPPPLISLFFSCLQSFIFSSSLLCLFLRPIHSFSYFSFINLSLFLLFFSCPESFNYSSPPLCFFLLPIHFFSYFSFH